MRVPEKAYRIWSVNINSKSVFWLAWICSSSITTLTSGRFNFISKSNPVQKWKSKPSRQKSRREFSNDMFLASTMGAPPRVFGQDQPGRDASDHNGDDAVSKQRFDLSLASVIR
jgi:hypothetical protein